MPFLEEVNWEATLRIRRLSDEHRIRTGDAGWSWGIFYWPDNYDEPTLIQKSILFWWF